MSDIYTVQLLDTVYGRIVLDERSASTESAAKTAAKANPPVSGPHAEAFSGTGNVVAQSQVLKVSGKDTSGNAVVSPVALPPVPTPTF